MHETSVQLTVGAQFPESKPVLPVKMRITTQHLLVHIFDFVLEALWEARRLSKPVVRVLFQVAGTWEWRSRCEVVGWENRLVLDFTVDPSLDVSNVGWSWEVDRVALCVYPGVGCPDQRYQ